MSKQPVRTAVLLAAGRGSRLRPYTDTTPKPLLTVKGVPTLDLYFNSLSQAGVENVVLVIHHLADQLEQYAATVESRFGIACITAKQTVLDGTASALEAVLSANQQQQSAESIINSPFLLIATDYLIPETFIPELLSFYVSIEEQIAISIKWVPQEELASRSSIRFADDERILKVVEKPEAGTAPSSYSANLAFVLPPEILNLLSKVQPSARGERELQTAINDYLATTGTARGLIQSAPSEWTPTLHS